MVDAEESALTLTAYDHKTKYHRFMIPAGFVGRGLSSMDGIPNICH